MVLVLLPGETLSSVKFGLRGHGTYELDGSLRASVAGSVERVDRLVSVRRVGGRYFGEVGDLVVGVIREIGHKTWKVDIGASRLATLTLSGVHLPNDVQRIRTRADAVGMRELFDVDDKIVAEIQSVKMDGSTHLQSRANRYGRIGNGELVKVRAGLVRRLPAHFATLDASKNIDIILGNNGYLWVQRKIPEAWIEEFSTSSGGGSGEIDAKLSADGWKAIRDRHAKTPLNAKDQRHVTRVANVLRVLGNQGASITPLTVDHLYDLSISMFPGDDSSAMLLTRHSSQLLQRLFDSEEAYHIGKHLLLDKLVDTNLGLDDEENNGGTPMDIMEDDGQQQGGQK